MSENTSDILREDLGGVDVSMPLLPKDTYLMTVKKCEVVDNKKGDGKNIKITLSTTTPTISVAGEPIAPGFPVYDTISLTPTPNYTKASILKKVKLFRQAVTGQAGGAFDPAAQYEGKNVKVVLKVQDEQGDYPAANKVARYEV